MCLGGWRPVHVPYTYAAVHIPARTRRLPYTGLMPQYIVKTVMWHLLNGLSYMHQHWVVHRDLKVCAWGGGGAVACGRVCVKKRKKNSYAFDIARVSTQRAHGEGPTRACVMACRYASGGSRFPRSKHRGREAVPRHADVHAAT